MAAPTNQWFRLRVQASNRNRAQGGHASLLRMGTSAREGLPSCKQFEDAYLDAGWSEQEIVAHADAQLTASNNRKLSRCRTARAAWSHRVRLQRARSCCARMRLA